MRALSSVTRAGPFLAKQSPYDHSQPTPIVAGVVGIIIYGIQVGVAVQGAAAAKLERVRLEGESDVSVARLDGLADPRRCPAWAGLITASTCARHQRLQTHLGLNCCRVRQSDQNRLAPRSTEERNADGKSKHKSCGYVDVRITGDCSGR